jgi:subtilase family serine protease
MYKHTHLHICISVAGLTVRHGSTQAVVEFYSEFYSNSDLSAFLKLSGLLNHTLPESHVRGNNPNDESNPGGEAQLDLEYLMVSG